MATYCISDIHGCYDEYMELLEKIHFSDEDTLYNLGDIIDRGPEPMKVLRDIMARPNVISILGNHEYMAYTILSRLNVEITEGNVETQLDRNLMEGIAVWFSNGGRVTLDAFRHLSREDKTAVLEFMSDMDLYEEIEVSGQDYILVHAGLGNFTPWKPLERYSIDELVWDRSDYGRVYHDDRILITGHTPTVNLADDNEGTIVRKNNQIAIDCGCCFGFQLGALCLETGEEFYVKCRHKDD